ncbi:MAG: SDR family NAD(P)-dependent oxidoreductase [Thermaerobacter sp.]|nr:SDR family NAD(P)-dependent oxidoreductase [Thermaerobacter sp.]
MKGRFDGATALITGGAGGIGTGVALRLGREGAHVAVADLTVSQAEVVAARVRQEGGRASAHALDVTQAEDVQRVLGEVECLAGTVTLAVTCAGIDSQFAFLDLPPEEWQRTLAVNLQGTFLVMQGVARRLKAKGAPGHIVAVASAAAKRPNPTQAHYGASKAGVVNLVRSAGVALARDGIVVNAVCPGVVDTAMTQAIHMERSLLTHLSVEESLDRMIQAIPIGRIETVDDVAHVVAFLLSEEANYMVGQAVNVCGGLAFD